MTIQIDGRTAPSISERNRLFDFYVVPRLDVLQRMVRYFTLSGEDYDDNYQEVLLHLLLHIGNYDPSRATFHSWMNLVVRNFMATLHRNRRHSNRAFAEAPTPQASGANATDDAADDSTSPALFGTLDMACNVADDTPAWREIDERCHPSSVTGLPLPPLTVASADYPTTYAALMRLPALQRRALLLAAEGWSVGEIAAEFSISYASASGILNRARATMRAAESNVVKEKTM